MKPTANQLIKQYYNVSRPVTDEEVIHELVNLRRKQKKGTLDDIDQKLVSALEQHGMFSQSSK